MQKVLLPLALLIFLCSPGAWAAEDEEEALPAKTSAYVSLGESMVLNLSNDSRRLTFLQVNADVLIGDSDAEALIEKHVPAIRHKLIVLLSEQKATDMKSSSKREEIRKIATIQVQELMTELTGKNDIVDILFSSFLVQ